MEKSSSDNATKPLEVGNVTSKRNGFTSYRFSHDLRTITTKSNNVAYEPRTITIGSENDFHKPRAIPIKIGNFLRSLEALCDNAKK